MSKIFIYLPLEIQMFNFSGELKNESRDKFNNFLKKIKYKFGFKEFNFIYSDELKNLINKKLEEFEDNKDKKNLFNYLDNSVLLKVEIESNSNIDSLEIKEKIIAFFEFLFGFIYFSYNFNKRQISWFDIRENYSFDNLNVIEHILKYFFVVEDDAIVNFEDSNLITLNYSLKENYFSEKQNYLDLDKIIRDVDLSWFSLLFETPEDRKLFIEIFSLYFKATCEKDMYISYFRYWVIIEKIVKREKQKDVVFIQKLKSIIIDERLNKKIDNLYKIRHDLVHKFIVKDLNLESRDDLKLVCNLVIDFYFQLYLDFGNLNYFYLYIDLSEEKRKDVDLFVGLYNKKYKEGEKISKEFLKLLFNFLKNNCEKKEIEDFLDKSI